ncbi:fimbrial assembly protein [Deinococcus sp. YIM 134068]|uniref:fimbrial assembly protein n=1 Tax=Deinococcus lichenicola TaxID=3118910 RepID=UPI002F95A810
MVELNLLPVQERKRSEPNVWKYASVAVAALTGLALIFPERVVAGKIGELRAEQDRLNGEIAALTAAKSEFDRLTATRRTLEGVTATAEGLRQNKTYWTNDVAAFSARLPKGNDVALTSMTVKSLDAGALASLQGGGVYLGRNVVREIELAGTARSQQAVVTFLNVYENDPDFAVNFRSLQQDGETGRFTFAASVGLVGEAAPAAGTTPDAATPGTGTATGTPAPAAPSGGNDVR